MEDYSRQMEGQIQESSNELAEKRVERDNLYKTLSTLETFAKSFKRNMAQKQKDLSKVTY